MTDEITIEVGELKLSGTPEKVAETLRKLGLDAPEGYYPSEGKGLMRISEMHPHHLVNAILKRYRKWVAELSEIREDPQRVLEMIKTGPISDKTLVALIEELVKKEGS